MGCRILVSQDGACFYDSVTESVFGLILEDLEEAESFQKWNEKDLRELTDKEFAENLTKFREERNNE